MTKICLLGFDASASARFATTTAALSDSCALCVRVSRVYSRAVVMVAVMIAMLVAAPSHAQGRSAGALDTTYGSAQTFNLNANVAAMAMQPDGKMVVGGTFTTINDVTRQYVLRLVSLARSSRALSVASPTRIRGTSCRKGFIVEFGAPRGMS